MTYRCAKCGYSTEDEQWPRFLILQDGRDIPGELPLSEMMERGWLPRIDPRDKDAPDRMLAALQRFFGEGPPGWEPVEVLLEPSP